VQESSVNIPVLTVSYATGMDLSQGGSIALNLETESEMATGYNVIADTTFGDPNSIITVGSHLDSVRAGPGMNDNGSGSSTNLELALQIARCHSNFRHRVRFCWWGAEELGLVGSRFYVREIQKNPIEFNKIILNLNFDMIASPNFIYAIYNGRGAAAPIREKCTIIQQTFEQHLAARGHSQVPTPFNGRSDYGPFIEVGIPAGGLFTGAEGRKTAAEATLFGGTAGTAYDVCYHRVCDTLANLNEEALGVMSDAAYGVTVRLATDPFLKEKFYFERNVTTSAVPFIYPTHPDAFSTF